jgi:hypothetical protein
MLIRRHHVWYFSCHFRRERAAHEDDVGMRSVSKPPARTLFPLVILLCCFGCAHPANQNTAAKSSQEMPFRGLGESPVSMTSSDSSLAIPQDGAGPPRDVPFRPRNLPSGTLLSVRLNDMISADGRRAGVSFTATLDEPIVMDGRTVVPRGAAVVGQVESAEHTNPSDRRGYLRLTLNSIEIGGRDLALSTSTLFARGAVGKPPVHSYLSSTVQLEQGRRLTFRLAEPLFLSSQVAVSRR